MATKTGTTTTRDRFIAMPTDEHDETSKIEETTSALLSTIDAYKKIADSLPISEELRAFRGDIREATAALDSIEEDSTAIDVRLMLQRKYFPRVANRAGRGNLPAPA